MTERQLVEVMARAIDPEPFARRDVGTHDTFGGERADAKRITKARGQATRALRAMLEHGPTERMIDAGWKESEKRDDAFTSCTPRDIFGAMLRAELGEDAQ